MQIVLPMVAWVATLQLTGDVGPLVILPRRGRQERAKGSASRQKFKAR